MPRFLICRTGSLVFALAGSFAVASRSSAQAAAVSKNGAASSAIIGEDSTFATRERAQWSALQRRDTSTFARWAAGAVDVDVSGARNVDRASAAQYVARCELSTFALDGFHVTRDSVSAVVTYNATVDETCWGQKAPRSLHVMSVYERGAGDWRLIAHSETPAAKW